MVRKGRHPTIARRLDFTDRLERARQRIAAIKRQQQSHRSAARRGDSAAQRVLDSLDRDRRKAEEDAGWLTVAVADLELAADPAAVSADVEALEPDEGEGERLCRVLDRVRAL